MLRTCALIFAAHLSLATAAPAQTYVAGIDDLPLMPGLSERDGGFVFDKPEGRIVEAVASGVGTVRAVAGYYATTLPQLGWKQQPDGSYMRENERLAIAARDEGACPAPSLGEQIKSMRQDIEGPRPCVTVRFTLSPN